MKPPKKLQSFSKVQSFSIITFVALLGIIQSSLPLYAASTLKSQLKKVENLIVAGKYDDAIARLKTMQVQFRNQPELLAELALAYMYKGDNPSARDTAESALLQDPKNHEAHWVLANVYMALGLNDKSATEYQLSIKYRSKKICKPCAKRSDELLKSLKH